MTQHVSCADSNVSEDSQQPQHARSTSFPSHQKKRWGTTITKQMTLMNQLTHEQEEMQQINRLGTVSRRNIREGRVSFCSCIFQSF